MKFSELTAQVKAWLQSQERVSCRALRRESELDDDCLADLKAELLMSKRVDTKDLQEAKALLEDLGEMAKWGNGEKDEG